MQWLRPRRSVWNHFAKEKDRRLVTHVGNAQIKGIERADSIHLVAYALDISENMTLFPQTKVSYL